MERALWQPWLPVEATAGSQRGAVGFVEVNSTLIV